MKKYLFIFGALVFFTITIITFAQEKSVTSIPQAIKSPSSVGAVNFPHQQHYEDFEIECKECHHETNAAELKFPHDNYFDDYWIDCKICHHQTGEITLAAHSCSKCHHDSPANIADETLSSKVVIHKSCWGCHEMETGVEASQSCKFCHTGTEIGFK